MPLITVNEFISSLSEKEQRDVQVLSDQLTGQAIKEQPQMETRTPNEVLFAQLFEGKTVKRAEIGNGDVYQFIFHFTDGTSVLITSESNMMAWEELHAKENSVSEL